MGGKNKETSENKNDKEEKRDNIYYWTALDHLKNNYAKYITSQEIDDILEEIKKEKKFVKREGVTEEENETGLFNLVEMRILEKLNKRKKREKEDSTTTKKNWKAFWLNRF